MLAFLHQGLGPGPLSHPPEQRASDADRDTAVDILCAAAADGRLTMTELDERVGSAAAQLTVAADHTTIVTVTEQEGTP